MALRMTASDGTVFGVFNQGNGDYVAAQDDRGFHHVPSGYTSLPRWSEEEAKDQLCETVREYERRLDPSYFPRACAVNY